MCLINGNFEQGSLVRLQSSLPRAGTTKALCCAANQRSITSSQILHLHPDMPCHASRASEAIASMEYLWCLA